MEGNGERRLFSKAAELRSWVQLPPGPFLSIWLTTALNQACFRLLSDNIARNAIEDRERLVTEIEMLKMALYLVSRRRSRN